MKACKKEKFSGRLVIYRWKEMKFPLAEKNPFNEFASSLFDNHRLISFENETNLDA